MKIVCRYLKRHKILLLVSVILISIQVASGLKIPDYMSDMVNNGIQNGGISYIVPEYLSVDLYELYERNGYDLKEVYGARVDKGFFKKTGYISEEEFLKLADMAFSAINEKINISNIDNIKKNNVFELYDLAKVIKLENRDNIINDRSYILINLLNERLMYNNINDVQIDYIIKVGIKMLITTVLFALSIIFSGYIAVKISSNIAMDLRRDLFKKILSLSARDYKKVSPASLITRCTKDIETIRSTLLSLIRRLLYSVIIAIGAVGITIKKSYSFSFMIFICIIFVILIFLAFLRKINSTMKAFFKNYDATNSLIRENVIGVMDVRAFNNQDMENKKFTNIMKNQKAKDILLYILFGGQNALIDLLLNLSILFLIWLGAGLIGSSDVLVGDIIAVTEYITYVIFSVIEALYTITTIPRMLICTRRIGEVFNINPDVIDNLDSVEHLISGNIEFKNVYFSYDGNTVLEDISFKVSKGDLLAIVGTTGSGKSTLLKLLMREYDVDSGEILLDGININKIKKSSIIDGFSYAPQKSVLLKGSIRENILFGNMNANDTDIDEVLKLTDSYNFIYSKSGLDSDVSQEAKNFSGGQKQRLSMARAILKKASIYIFDDCFSALDVKTDEIVRNNIFNKLDKKTKVVVAQRLSTIVAADNILVLDNGRVVGQGNHIFLKENCEVYKSILESQRGNYEETEI